MTCLFPRQLLDGCCVVYASGEIDVAVADRFRRELDLALFDCSRWLLVDLSAVTFMDSTALSALVSVYHRAAGRGGCLGVVGSSDRVTRLLHVTQLDRVLPTYASLAEAGQFTQQATSGSALAHVRVHEGRPGQGEHLTTTADVDGDLRAVGDLGGDQRHPDALLEGG
jgi:anti-sigma B factor antagonist